MIFHVYFEIISEIHFNPGNMVIINKPELKVFAEGQIVAWYKFVLHC